MSDKAGDYAKGEQEEDETFIKNRHGAGDLVIRSQEVHFNTRHLLQIDTSFFVEAHIAAAIQ